MKALQFDKTGDLSALRYVEVATPVPGVDEVLVEIKAAGLNPSDVKNVLGRFPYTTLPRIPGRDFAGIVVEGPQALVGQHVWGTGRELGFFADGSHAQFVKLPANGVALKPTHLSFAQAASLGVPYTTAWDALERSLVTAETRLLVIGGGAVGSAALALAKVRGAQVLAPGSAAARAGQGAAGPGFSDAATGQARGPGRSGECRVQGRRRRGFRHHRLLVAGVCCGIGHLRPYCHHCRTRWMAWCSYRPWRCIARAVRWLVSTRCSTAYKPARRCWISSVNSSIRTCYRCPRGCSSRHWQKVWNVMQRSTKAAVTR